MLRLALLGSLPMSALAQEKAVCVQEKSAAVEKKIARSDQELSYRFNRPICESTLRDALLHYRTTFQGKALGLKVRIPAGMTKENARDYIIALIKENKNDCVNHFYIEEKLYYSPLYQAMVIGDLEIIQLLIDHGAILGECWTIPYDEKYKALILNNKDPKMKAFLQLIEKNKQTIEKEDLELYSRSIRQYGESILLNALMHYQYNFRGKDLWMEFPMPAGMTKENARDYIIALIKENKNNCVNHFYREVGLFYTPLYQAMKDGDLELMQLLIDQGSSLREEDILSSPEWYKELITDNKDPKVQASIQLLEKNRKQIEEKKDFESYYQNIMYTGESILLNAIMHYQYTFRGKDHWMKTPMPAGMTKENARDYIIALIKENKKDCVNNHYREGDLSYSPLYKAMKDGDLEFMQLLIDQGSSLREEDILSISVWYKKLITDNKDPKVQASIQLLEKNRKQIEAKEKK